ncbi:MAG TPA: hypothetical protein VFU22_24635 [Roseiflexaceae bacterium]|nr:hypothetical protein [Roseiflexaceae bacterium]
MDLKEALGRVAEERANAKQAAARGDACAAAFVGPALAFWRRRLPHANGAFCCSYVKSARACRACLLIC